MEPRILIESTSPLCKIQALVEESDTCVYFYLCEKPEAESPTIRTCWVRNYAEAPASPATALQAGEAPMQPAEFCSHPAGAERLDPTTLSIVWFEEGDGAALLSDGEILCVIPGWAGTTKCPGYALACTKPSPFAWPLGSADENALVARVRMAQDFWETWDDRSWPSIQNRLLGAITAALGPHDTYYAIDGGHWPPKALIRIEREDVIYLVTVGVSIPSQPKVEQYAETPENLRRFELAMAIGREQFRKSERRIMSYISALTNLPWSRLSWLGHGHTIPCDQIQRGSHDFSAILLLKAPSGVPHIDLGSYRGDPINLLWMVPVTSEERKFAQDHGNDELVRRSMHPNFWIHDGSPKFTPKPGLFDRIQNWRPWRS